MPTKKATPKKTAKRVAARKDVSASSASVLAAKANAERTAQPGIIGEIMATLVTAKSKKHMMTVEEIVAHLSKKFPERDTVGMTTTVRAQLSRLPNEKDFKIRSLRDGRRVRYAAA